MIATQECHFIQLQLRTQTNNTTIVSVAYYVVCHHFSQTIMRVTLLFNKIVERIRSKTQEYSYKEQQNNSAQQE